MPPLVTGPAELRAWRLGLGASQLEVAEILGCNPRSFGGWERGERMQPPLLAWALIAAADHVSSLVAFNIRKRRAASRRLHRNRLARQCRNRAAARRELQREAVRERRAELDAQQKLQKADMAETLRVGGQWIRQQEKAGKIRPPGSPPLNFIKPPRQRVVRPRKIRSDIGQAHNFRGRPGKRLRPEDISHEEA